MGPVGWLTLPWLSCANWMPAGGKETPSGGSGFRRWSSWPRPSPPPRLFLELKAGSLLYPGIEEELAHFLTEHGPVERTQVSSFDHQALLRLRRLLPDLPTGMLYHCLPVDPVAMARACGANAIHPHWSQVTRDHVAAAHQAGLVVNAWTVNTQEAIDQCRALGVDGIISDHPERL